MTTTRANKGKSLLLLPALLLIALSCVSAVARKSPMPFPASQAQSGPIAKSDSIATDSTSLPTDSIAADSIPFPTDSIPFSTDSISSPSDSTAAKVEKKPRTPRKATPVDIDDNKPQVVMHYYDKHGNALDEPVRFLAVLDTVTKPKSKPLYPLYNGWSLGANFGEAIFMAAGQKYASFDLWADISLFNWFFPVVEAGIGFADSTPKESNFTYKTSPSFYAKVGFNYNFMYKSDPAYQLFAGFRVGFSSFKYDIENVTISNGYWDETQTINMRGLKASAIYGEALLGIKVKIVGPFSLGWTGRYHFKMKVNSKSASTPWFIPGYGANSPFAVTVSAIYMFGQKKIEKTDLPLPEK